MPNKEEFIKVWEETPDIREVAKKLNLTYGSARTIAWRLRKEGLVLTKRPRGFEKDKKDVVG